MGASGGPGRTEVDRMLMLGFFGHSNSGKTTVVEKLVRRYKRRGLCVAVIKHTAHRGFELDVEGSDSSRHAKAGADAVGLLSDKKAAVLIHRLPAGECPKREGKGPRGGQGDDDVELLVNLVKMAVGPDILFLEGFKHAGVEKVAVGDIGKLPGTIFCLAGPSDAKGLGRLEKLIDGKLATDRVRARLPGADCGRCGLDCDTFAQRVACGKRRLSQCDGLSDVRLRLWVDGTEVLLSRFPKEMVAGALTGLISSLKMPSGETIGSRRPRRIELVLEK